MSNVLIIIDKRYCVERKQARDVGGLGGCLILCETGHEFMCGLGLIGLIVLATWI